jgi:hypothetical protein
MPAFTLNDLSGDNLRAIADDLKPRDRLSLATCSKRFLHEVWGDLAVETMTNKFPFEQRMEFDLQVDRIPNHAYPLTPTTVTSTNGPVDIVRRDARFRIVPERSQVQHCFVSVSSDGHHVAVLAYDNVLRVLNPFSKSIIAELHLDGICGANMWDLSTGKHVSGLLGVGGTNSYEEDAGVDAEIGFSFSQDARNIVVSGKSGLHVFEIGTGTNQARVSINVRTALDHLTENNGIGGSSALSPDNRTAAWVIFAGRPASAYVTTWNVESGVCLTVSKVMTIRPANRSALGWCRVQFSPNGRFLLVIANNGRKAYRTLRVEDHLQTVKCSEYVFEAYDTSRLPLHLSNQPQGALTYTTGILPTRKFTEWLDLRPESYPEELAFFILALIDGLHTHDIPCRDVGADSKLSQEQEMRVPRVHFNSLHSCPSEATLKSFSFVPHARHKWFVTKQPMYSIHVSLSSARALMTVSPHGNKLFALSPQSTRDERRQTLVRSNDEAVTSEDEKSSRAPKRSHAFHGLPWKACFAAASGFSASGKWLASVNLVEDKCVVCVRNITVDEYFK